MVVEQRLARCEHCGKGIALSYQRALRGHRLRSSIITTAQEGAGDCCRSRRRAWKDDASASSRS